jgi:hypothetical protein
MKLHVLGIDLGKTVVHLVGLDSTGRLVIRKKCSRRQLLAFTANLEVQLIGMESCSGSQFLGRALREQGHEVRLMPAQYVKPYPRVFGVAWAFVAHTDKRCVRFPRPTSGWDCSVCSQARDRARASAASGLTTVYRRRC